MAKNIRDRRLDRPADEAIEMKTLEVKKEEEREEEEEVNSRDPIQLKTISLYFCLKQFNVFYPGLSGYQGYRVILISYSLC